jgi:formamidopyrimidine-DNA glycosylase
VCSTSVDLLGDSENFPEDWLFKYRWSKGKKNQVSALPNGDKIVFLTVGGRTSAVVPAVQKKTGPVTKEISDEDVDEGEKEDLAESGSKRKRRVASKNEGDGDGPSSKKMAAKRDKGSVIEKSSNSQKPTKREALPNTTGKQSGLKGKDDEVTQLKGRSKTASRGTRRSTRSTK